MLDKASKEGEGFDILFVHPVVATRVNIGCCAPYEVELKADIEPVFKPMVTKETKVTVAKKNKKNLHTS
jgi:hypothetical protein